MIKPLFVTQNSMEHFILCSERDKELGMYHKLARGKLYDADDYEIYKFKNSNAFQSFPVGRGQDGKIWSFKGVRGTIKLMTVPPYFL